MKKLILVSALLGSMLIAGAAELIHLKMDFSRPGWNEILSPQGGETTVRDGELSLSAGSSVVTPYFPLTPGELELVTHPERFEVRLKVVEWWETVKNWMRG